MLDGKLRLKACEMAGVTPRIVAYEGPDPLAFIVSCNFRRQALTAAERRAVEARVLAEWPNRKRSPKPPSTGPGTTIS